jgi:DNA-binding PadR family transcriptional regulator
LEQKGWLASEYGPSDNNRKARFYSLTRQGKKQLIAELEQWELTVSLMSRLLEAK